MKLPLKPNKYAPLEKVVFIVNEAYPVFMNHDTSEPHIGEAKLERLPDLTIQVTLFLSDSLQEKVDKMCNSYHFGFSDLPEGSSVEGADEDRYCLFEVVPILMVNYSNGQLVEAKVVGVSLVSSIAMMSWKKVLLGKTKGDVKLLNSGN